MRRRFESCRGRPVMSQDIPDSPNLRQGSGCCRFRGGGPGGRPVAWCRRVGSRVRWRRSSPVAASMTRTSRSVQPLDRCSVTLERGKQSADRGGSRVVNRSRLPDRTEDLPHSRRARPRTRSAGSGYTITDDTALKTLPPQPPGTVVQRRGAGEVPRVQGGARARPTT